MMTLFYWLEAVPNGSSLERFPTLSNIYIKCMPSVATSIIMALMVIMVLAKACLNLFTFLLPYTGIPVIFLNYPICSFDLSFLYQ